MTPLVSIILPTFNRSAWTLEAIESVRRQTYPGWEAVVVDDGSTDDTLVLLEQIAQTERRLKVLARDRLPKGAPTCRNVGLHAARGECVIYLDSDDLLAPHCLAGRVEALARHPGADFVVFPMLRFAETPGDSRRLWNTITPEPDVCRFARGDSVWQTTGPIWRKGALLRIGGFDEALTAWQDVDLHLRALLDGLRYVKRLGAKPDAFVRRHTRGSISQGGLKSREALRSMIRVFQKACNAVGRPGEPAGLRLTLLYSLNRILRVSVPHQFMDLSEEALGIARRAGLLDHPAGLTPANEAFLRLRQLRRTRRFCPQADLPDEALLRELGRLRYGLFWLWHKCQRPGQKAVYWSRRHSILRGSGEERVECAVEAASGTQTP